MWPILRSILSRNAFYVSIPFGFLGYYMEGLISNRYTPPIAAVSEQREERLLKDMDSVPDKKRHNPLEVNLPPSLTV